MSVIKLEHLEIFLKSKQKKGVYGSVLIQIQDGKFKQVNFNETLNPEGFVQYVENLLKRVTRVIVKSKKVHPKEGTDINTAEDSSLSTSVENPAIKGVECDKTKGENLDISAGSDSVDKDDKLQ